MADVVLVVSVAVFKSHGQLNKTKANQIIICIKKSVCLLAITKIIYNFTDDLKSQATPRHYSPD